MRLIKFQVISSAFYKGIIEIIVLQQGARYGQCRTIKGAYQILY